MTMQMPLAACHLEMTTTSTGKKGEEMDMLYAIKVLNLQVKPVDANILHNDSGKDHDNYSDVLCLRRVATKAHYHECLILDILA